jgi:opacity protein-like surface antigen
MKKSIIVIAAICITNFVLAQDIKKNRKSSINFRTAFSTALDTKQSIIENHLQKDLLGNRFATEIKNGLSLQYALSYGFDISNFLTVTIVGAHQKVKSYTVQTLVDGLFDFNPQITSVHIATSKQTTIIGKIDFNYMNDSAFSCYSGFGVGVGQFERKGLTNSSIDKKKQDLIYHLTILGIKTKGKIGFSIEVGSGALGLLSAGVNARF